MKYKYFKKIIEEYEEITEYLYNALVDAYGKDKVDDCFERYINDPTVANDDAKFKKVNYYLEKNNNVDGFESIEYLTSTSDFDMVKMYLKEIGTIPLYTEEEEYLKSKKLDELNKLLEKRKVDINIINELLKGYNIDVNLKESMKIQKLYKLLEQTTNKKEINKIKKIISDLELYNECLTLENEFLCSNLRLVVSVAKKYTGSGVPLLDLIQEGNIGLKKAIKGYNVEKGFKFSTYATWWIRQAITRSIADQSRIIRIPVHMNDWINKIGTVERELEFKLLRTPSPKEILKYFEEKSKQILIEEGIENPSEKEIQAKTGLTIEKIIEIRKIGQKIASLDVPVGEDEENTLLDFVADSESESLEEEVVKNSYKDYVINIISSLSTQREKLVIILRYGLQLDNFLTLEEFVSVINQANHNYSQDELFVLYEHLSKRPSDLTLEKVGNIFGVTRERVRQIEGKALRKLRFKTRYDRDFL